MKYQNFWDTVVDGFLLFIAAAYFVMGATVVVLVAYVLAHFVLKYW